MDYLKHLIIESKINLWTRKLLLGFYLKLLFLQYHPIPLWYLSQFPPLLFTLFKYPHKYCCPLKCTLCVCVCVHACVCVHMCVCACMYTGGERENMRMWVCICTSGKSLPVFFLFICSWQILFFPKYLCDFISASYKIYGLWRGP